MESIVQNMTRVLAANLSKLRKARGLTQESLAEKAGISHRMIQKIELRQSWPSSETLGKLLEALGADPEDLLIDAKATKNTEHGLIETLKLQADEIIKLKASATSEKFHREFSQISETTQPYGKSKTLDEIVGLLENQPESRLVTVLKIVRDLVASDSTLNRKKKNLR